MRLFLTLPLLCCLAAPALAADWISSGALEGFAELQPAERERITPLIASKIISYSFEDAEIDWQIHPGDLKVAGNFDNDAALIVDGDLVVDGTYDDYGKGIGHLIVLGDFEAENIFSWNGLYVRGMVKASGLVFGAYSDYAFEVDGGVAARGIVLDDHSSSFAVQQAEFRIDNTAPLDIEQFGKALRLLLPEILADPDTLDVTAATEVNSLWPSYDEAKNLVRSGRSPFRAQEAPASLVEDLRLALDPGSSDPALLAILGHDTLSDRVVAARRELSTPLIDALVGLKDPGVRSWLAGHVTDLGKLGGAAALTVPMAERLVANPETPEKTLRAIAKLSDVALRRTLAQRQDLPQSVLSIIAKDSDTDVRAGVLRNFDNAERLSKSEQARLAKDKDPGVREAIASALLPFDIAQKLAKDESRGVRRALAYCLARQVGHPFPVAKSEEREKLAEMLFAEDDDEIASAVFTALSPARQLEIYRQGERQLDWPEIARTTRNPALMQALLDNPGDLVLQGNLAENLALPLDLQLVIVARAKEEPAKKCELCFLFETTDRVLAALIENENFAPQAIEEASQIAEARPSASFVSSLELRLGTSSAVEPLGLKELAELSRSAPTLELRKSALERYAVLKLRSW